MQITIRVKDNELKRMLASGKDIRKATARSLNEIMKQAKTQSSRDIKKEVSLKSSVIKAHISDTKARQNDPVDVQKALISYSRRGVSLLEYQGRVKPMGKSKLTHTTLYGATVKVKTARETVAGGFIRTMKSGKRGIFKRTTKKRRPIEMLYGPSVGDLASDTVITNNLNRLIDQKYAAIFSRNLAFILSR